MSICSGLTDLVRTIADEGLDLRLVLNKGLSLSEFESSTRDLGFSLPSELRELYCCCNGANREAIIKAYDYGSIPGYDFLPLDSAIILYDDLKELYTPGKMEAYWFPIFADPAGDAYVVPCDQVANRSQVLIFETDSSVSHVAYASIEEMIGCISLFYKTGAFIVDSSGPMIELMIDEDTYRRVGKRANPDAPYWSQLVKGD